MHMAIVLVWMVLKGVSKSILFCFWYQEIVICRCWGSIENVGELVLVEIVVHLFNYIVLKLCSDVLLLFEFYLNSEDENKYLRT